MAELRTPPRGAEGNPPLPPFDRQALEATLADALRDAQASADPTSAGPGPAAEATPPSGRSPRPAQPGPEAAPEKWTSLLGSAMAGLGRPVGTRSNTAAPQPAASQTSPSPAPGPQATAPDPGPVPGLIPAGLTKLRGPAGPPTASPAPSNPNPGITADRPNPVPGLTPGGLSQLRRPDSPEADPPAGLRPLATPGQLVSGLASKPQVIDDPDLPAEPPAIALRRPTRPAAGPAATRTPSPAPAPVPVPAARPQSGPAGSGTPARPPVPVAAWLPTDDDILPQASAKRRGRRRRKG